VRLVSVPADPDHPFAFRPQQVTVRAGQTVRWVNTEDVFHTVTSTDSLDRLRPNRRFDKALSRRGQIFDYTFRQPGTYHYYCQPHAPFMVGTVRVE
jgi:plastocyanin